MISGIGAAYDQWNRAVYDQWNRTNNQIVYVMEFVAYENEQLLLSDES